MANKRMFSLDIVDSDAFLDMPTSSREFYFQLCMRADDEGFVGNPKKILRMLGGNDDDLKILIAKRFILTFESGVVVIKHWLIHNTIRMDRFHKTTYQDEKKCIKVKENGGYTESGNQLATSWQPVGSNLVPQVKLSKVKLSKGERDGATAPTLSPSQEMNELISSEKTQEQAAQSMVRYGFTIDTARREISKWLMYWTEKTQSGKKMRWETEKTFEPKKRLITWFRKAQDYAKQ